MPKPVICKEHRVEEPNGLSGKYPSMFPACAVTLVMSKKVAGSKFSIEEVVNDPTMVDLSETFMCDPDFGKTPELTSPLKTPKVSEFVQLTLTSRKQLIAEQRNAVSLSSLFAEIHPEEEFD